MTRTVLFIHSAGIQAPKQGSYDFVEWLRRTLGDSYHVFYPMMPDPETPEYLSWREQLELSLALLDEEIFLVGHSLGGAVILKYLSEEKITNKIKGLFLIAVPFWGKDDEWQIEEFILQEDFAKTMPSIQKTVLYHSIDDEWVPSEHMISYQRKLRTAVTHLVPGRDHEFKNGLPILAEEIKKLSEEITL